MPVQVQGHTNREEKVFYDSAYLIYTYGKIMIQRPRGSGSTTERWDSNSGLLMQAWLQTQNNLPPWCERDRDRILGPSSCKWELRSR